MSTPTDEARELRKHYAALSPAAAAEEATRPVKQRWMIGGSATWKLSPVLTMDVAMLLKAAVNAREPPPPTGPPPADPIPKGRYWSAEGNEWRKIPGNAGLVPEASASTASGSQDDPMGEADPQTGVMWSKWSSAPKIRRRASATHFTSGLPQPAVQCWRELPGTCGEFLSAWAKPIGRDEADTENQSTGACAVVRH